MNAKFTRAVSRAEQTVTDSYTQDGVRHQTSTRTVVDMVVDSVEFHVEREVCRTLTQIQSQDTKNLDFAPHLRVDPLVNWQHDKAWLALAAARREAIDNSTPPATQASKPVNVARGRQRVMNWVCNLSARDGVFRPFLESFLALLEEVNLALDAHWAQKQERARNFTPEMTEGLKDPQAYRILHESHPDWGLPQEVEAVALALSTHCIQCSQHQEFFFAFGLDEDCFAGFVASEPKFKAKAAWREMHNFVAADFSNVLEVARTAHAVLGGWVEGPIMLHEIGQHPPPHFSLWSPDARMRYWARVSSAQSELWVPVACALQRWPWLAAPVQTSLHHLETQKTIATNVF